MRTTIDLPDDLFRKTKAAAAMEGSTLKAVIVRAIEREVNGPAKTVEEPPKRRIQFPFIKTRRSTPLNLDNFDFDDLLT